VRSFRAALALRVGAGALLLFTALGLAAVATLRTLLGHQLDATLLRIAETEAQAGADAASADFAFHEGVLLAGNGGVPELTRYAQLWSSDGTPLIRSANLTQNLILPTTALVEARAGRLARVTHTGPDGAELRSLVYPLRLVGEVHGHHVLQVAAPTAPLRQTVARFAGFVAVLALTMTVGAWLMGWRVAGTALRPTAEITAQAHALGAGSLPARITAHADVAEFRQLVTVLNEMLERLDASFQSQRRFTADASHELRAPLNVLRGEIDVALKRPRTAAEYQVVLERCRDEVLRLARLASDLLVLARADAGGDTSRREDLDLADLAAGVADRYRGLAAPRGITVRVEGGPVTVAGHGELIERALGNLVDNAVKYMRGPGVVTIRVGENGAPVVDVSDTGPGVTAADVPHLFERFYRADPVRPRAEGSGLGLAIARAAIEAHGGNLTFLGNAPGGGARFRFVLPAARTAGTADDVVLTRTDD
jgi:two-component system, OmpR family, sensor kinase